jgi:uncharacterized protein (DUF2141 family)
MKYFGAVSALFISMAGILVMLGGSGCANIFPPTGGPKDTLPPVLVRAIPENSSLNFTANRITLEFDEYLDLKDIQQNLLVSPVPKQMPTVESRLKTITIRLKDSLQPHTTYTLNFGNAIHDVNEGNILKNFTYIFSTGSYLDTMEFSGKVVLAETGKIDSTLIVMLHQNYQDDSAVAKERPRYIARVNREGNFHFHFIHPGTYAIFALQDDAGQHKYTSKAQLFAFSDTPIVVRPYSNPVTLLAFSDTTGSKPARKSAAPTAAAKKTAKQKEQEKRLIIHANIVQGEVDLLSPLEFQFEKPLKYFDSSKVSLTDENFNPIRNYHWQLDTNMKKLTLVHNWPSDTKFHLTAAKDFAQDTAGNQLLKTDTISFRTRKESDYGSLRLRFTNLDLSRNPVLIFVKGESVIKKYVFGNTRVFYEKLFNPGEYELRILYDRNKNGRWDTGNFFGERRQPEQVQPVNKKLNVRANWDNEVDITL